jgi:hypothetical protein
VDVYAKCDIDYLQEQARSICDQHLIPRLNVIADEDGVGGGFVDNFKCRGFLNNGSPIQPPEVEWDKTKRVNYQNLKTQCAFHLAGRVNKRAIAIETKLHMDEIIEECEQVQEIESEGKIRINSKEDMKDNLGRSPDMFDMLFMRSWFDLAGISGMIQEEYEPTIIKFETDKWGRAKIK